MVLFCKADFKYALKIVGKGSVLYRINAFEFLLRANIAGELTEKLKKELELCFGETHSRKKAH